MVIYQKIICSISLGLLRLNTSYLAHPHYKFLDYLLISILTGALLIFYEESKKKMWYSGENLKVSILFILYFQGRIK